MSLLACLLVCATLGSAPAESEPPTLPDDTAPGEPAEPEPDEPTPSPEPTIVAPSADPTVAAAPAATPPPASDDERAPQPDDDARDRKTVKTREAGDWGMTFTFGGLAPMSIAGINDFAVNRLLFSELGFRAALDRVVIPFSVGAGFFSHRPSGSTALGDVGVGASVAVLADFRRGRRIIPHAGGALHFHYVDPSGRSNYLFNISFGPVIGIEYFFADSVSLLLQGKLNLGFNVLDGLTQIDFGTTIAAGGQMGLTFYF
jgi:hypothetical protein